MATPVLIVAAGAVAAGVVVYPAVSWYRSGKPLRASDKVRIVGSVTIVIASCMLSYYYARRTSYAVPEPMAPRPVMTQPAVGGRSVSVPMPPPPTPPVMYGGDDYKPFKYVDSAVPVPAKLAVGGGEAVLEVPAPVLDVPAPDIVIPAAPVLDVPSAPVIEIPATPVPAAGGASVTIDGNAVVLEGFEF